MHKISLAPVLSATLSRDSCWITALLPFERPACLPASSFLCGAPGVVPRANTALLGLFEDLDDAPTLRRRQRSRLHQEDPVADTTLVGLVVRLEPVGPSHDLAVKRVLHAVFDLDHHGLVHLVA